MVENSTISQNIPISELIKPFLIRWKLFLVCMLIAGILGYLFIYYSTPLYRVQSKVVVRDAKKSLGGSELGGLAGISGLNDMPDGSIQNELQVFGSKDLLESITNQLQLQITQFQKEKNYDVELFGNELPFQVRVLNEKPFNEGPKQPFKIAAKGDKITITSPEMKEAIVTTFGRLISLPYANFMVVKNQNFNPKSVKGITSPYESYFRYTPTDFVVERLQKNLKVNLTDKEGTVVELLMIYPNVNKAKAILNTIIAEYNLDAQSEKDNESKKTRDFIDERIAIVGKELGDVESQKQRFKVENNIVDLPTQARMDLQQNAEAKRRLMEMETQIQLNGMLLSSVNRGGNGYLPANIGFDNAVASKIVENYNELVQRRNKTLETATQENPLVIELNREMAAIRNTLRDNLQKSGSSLQLARNQILRQEQISDYGMSQVPEKEKLFRNIERQQQTKENLYMVLLQKREEAAIKLAATSQKAKVIDTAYHTMKPVSPKRIITMASALLLGFLLPFFYILVRQLLNSKIHDKHDIEKLSNTPVVGEIPRNKKGNNTLIKINENSSTAEAFRILATNLKFLIPEKQTAKRILMTSSVKGEGKTYISMNTALTLVSPGKKVLVIGADLRNPQLQRYNEDKKSAKGLSEFLYGEVKEVSKIIFPSNINSDVDFIYSGSIPPNPVDLLANGKMQELLQTVENEYSYIIIDAAPMMPVTDTKWLLKFADVLVYVIRSEYSDRKFVNFYNTMKEQNAVEKSVFVINDVKQSNFGYGNTYGYGYRETEKSFWQRINPFSK